MFERFTERARQVVVLAQEEANKANRESIESTAILYGLWLEGEGLGRRVLESLGGEEFGITTIERWLVLGTLEGAPEQEQKRSTGDPLPFTYAAKKVLELALREALSLGHNYIGTEHILLGVVRENDCMAAVRLRDHWTSEHIRGEVIRQMAPRSPRVSGTNTIEHWRTRALEAESKLDQVSRLVRSLRGIVG